MQEILLSQELVHQKDFFFSEIVKKAIDEKILSNHNSAAIFFNLTEYKNRLTELASAFPKPALNALAVKTNSLVSMLRIAADMGFGAECASIGEIAIAKKAGFDPKTIVFDSPVKTEYEIRYALQEQIYINADNIQELEIIQRMIENGQTFRKGSIGLRVNPALPLSNYTAKKSFSKREKEAITGISSAQFGVMYDQAKQLLIENPAYSKILTGFHVHIGSQNSPIEMLVDGIKKVVDFAEYLNANHQYQIDTFDIGGGLPIQYTDADTAINFTEFSNLLSLEVPKLKNYKVITENGRAVFAKPGWGVSKIEYVKTAKNENGEAINIALTHLGRNILSRYHEMVLLNQQGDVKTGRHAPHTIAGPLPFSGDLIAQNRLLPLIKPGDWLIIKDMGAYTFTEWWLNAGRRFPPIIGYDENLNITILHKGQTAEELADFWGKTI